MVSDPKPEVSIVIAAFNPGMRIVETLDSVISQTLDNFETFLVDDSSTEDLLPLVGRYRELEYIRFEKNQGPGAARNAAIKRAKGRYIAVLDSDDVWFPERLERLLSYLEDSPSITLATSDSLLMFEEVKSTRSWFSTEDTRFQFDDQSIHIFRSNFLSGLVVYRRDLFERHGYYDESLRMAEDWDRNIAFLVAGEKAGFVAQPLAYHRVHSKSLSHDELSMALHRRKVLDKWLKSNLCPRQMYAARQSRIRIDWDLLKGDHAQADHRRIELLKLILSGPSDIKMKAFSGLILPQRLLKAFRTSRQRLLVKGGGAWALEEALSWLTKQDYRSARPSILAVVLYGTPIRIRLLAILWLIFRPTRSWTSARILAESRRLGLSPRIQ